jgi:hypothetical protein
MPVKRPLANLSLLLTLLAAIIVLGTVPAYSQQAVLIETSADDFDGRFFGEGILQVLITDESSDDNSSIEDVTVDIDAQPDSGAGGSGSFAIPETSESSGRYEFYLMHIDADDVSADDIDPINTAGVEGAAGAGTTAAPVITFGTAGADLEVEGAEDSFEEVEFMITVGDTEITVNYEQSNANLILDRPSYGSNNFVYISVHDNDANKNPTAVDEFTVDPSAGPNSDLLDLSGGQITQTVVFRETGDNTAVFKGKYQLGSSITVSSKALVLLLNDKANYEETLDADENDSNFTVEVSFTVGDTSGSIGVNEGQQNETFDPVFSLARSEYRVGESVQLTITDQDANVNADAADSIVITARATPSNAETEITALETGANTGVFAANFTIDAQSTDNSMIILYSDMHPAGDSGQKEFSGQISILPAGRQGIDATTVGRPVLKDTIGMVNPSLAAGQQVMLSTEIANNNDASQPFVALVEVRDSHGLTVFLQWQTGTLNPSGQAEVGLSWTPDKAGSYYVRTFVVSSLAQEIQVLSAVQESVVTVS